MVEESTLKGQSNGEVPLRLPGTGQQPDADQSADVTGDGESDLAAKPSAGDAPARGASRDGADSAFPAAAGPAADALMLAQADAAETVMFAEIGAHGERELAAIKAWIASGCEGPKPQPDAEARRALGQRLSAAMAVCERLYSKG